MGEGLGSGFASATISSFTGVTSSSLGTFFADGLHRPETAINQILFSPFAEYFYRSESFRS